MRFKISLSIILLLVLILAGYTYAQEDKDVYVSVIAEQGPLLIQDDGHDGLLWHYFSKKFSDKPRVLFIYLATIQDQNNKEKTYKVVNVQRGPELDTGDLGLPIEQIPSNVLNTIKLKIK